MRVPLSWVRSGGTPERTRRGLFLDRDGVLNEHIKGGYVMRWADFVWKPGVMAALRELSTIDLPIIVVSNQSCVGRGLVQGDEIVSIMNRVVLELGAAGVELAGWYFCPHTPVDACSCRKPGTGMLLAAAAELHIDLQRSYLIGDSSTDIEAGEAVGCATWLIERPEDFERAIADITQRERLIATAPEVSSW